MSTHSYSLTVTWTGDRGDGTTSLTAYDRDHVVSATGKPDLPGSADTAFRGDPTRWNPEELLVASLSQCHMLWYLGLAASAGIVVVGYRDQPSGTMTELPDGAGQFDDVTLRPVVTVTEAAVAERARALHADAHEKCFIARSVAFPVHHEPTVLVA
ncbi:OsmC family peroxiredoxin [Rhodococcus rhodnii]|uniref:Redox protein n=2 Tax=Rhodococcus rhodnii TaxID=38312 RepID=R7WIL4_9NOCA|nr:OsmC family protein [Rhodococcus rhodnii]EOM75038.1 redox protein [Rhodococcus rhodnii LMG 5362]TXG91141.1 OsmC family peroxiredoxin [Rhodococcus rhodnii]